jgi:DNA-binding beta-propeller fold protein YncE
MMKYFNLRFSNVMLMILVVFYLNIGETQQSSSTLNKADKTISLPGGEAGIGFDDLQFSSSLNKVLVPGGRTGNLCLIDSKDQSLSVISGFSEKADYSSGHGDGITSVDEGEGVLYVTDRSSLRLNVVDIASKSIIARADLAGGPDYVRFVAPTKEVWVTEPEKDRIEIFTLPANKKTAPVHSEFISIPGGPEALVVDKTRGKAYTHLWKKETVTIDLKSHKVISTWPNGCEGSRGIALEESKGLLYVGCAEGKAVALDLTQNGKQISSISSGSGVDIIAYNPKLSHLYLPGGKSATMAILGVSESGDLSLLGTVETAQGSHCVTTDLNGNVYVCDPHKGQLLLFQDHYLSSRK